MREAPKIYWPIRLAALILALGAGFYVLQFYVMGQKFAGAINALSKLPASAPQAQAPSEPGVVPVMILSDKKKAK